MQYKQLGETGLIVSRLSLGTMTFTSGDKGAVAKVDEVSARALLTRALDAGVNFFDTADVYAGGRSEEILGAFLKPRRDEAVLCTKIAYRVGPGMNQAGLSRKHLLAACEASLKRLGTDHVDVLMAHKGDLFTPLEETLEALDALVRQGKVRYIGCSNWPAWMIAKAVQMQKDRGWARFITAQMHYSLLGRDIEHDFVPMLRDAGAGLMVWSPLAGGFLSGKYTRGNLKAQENRLSGFDVMPFDKEVGFGIVEKAREVGARHGASVAQVSLAWLLAQPSVATVLIGASSLSQLEDNLGADALALTPDDLAALDEATLRPPMALDWLELTMDEQTRKALAG